MVISLEGFARLVGKQLKIALRFYGAKCHYAVNCFAEYKYFPIAKVSIFTKKYKIVFYA